MRGTDPAGLVVGGRYEIVDAIARGGQGIVCRAHDLATGVDVAVKMLHDVASNDPQFTERLKREQHALAELAGTNAVRLLDACTSESGALCLVMELLDGVDLEHGLDALEVEGRRMPVSQMLEVLRPLVDTLTRAHAAGILHRDLKPANVFLLSERAGSGVRLLDFGFARLKRARPLTAAGIVMGSPSYIAPEVWKGEPGLIDQRADVYSLAVIAFRILAGRPPFETSSLAEMLTLATTAKRPSLHALRPDLPQEIDAWCEQALAVEPRDRFRTVRALYSSLEDVLTGEQPAGVQGAGGFAAAWRAAKDAVRRLAAVADPRRPTAPEPAERLERSDGAESSQRLERSDGAESSQRLDASAAKEKIPPQLPRLPPPPPRRPPPPEPAPSQAGFSTTLPAVAPRAEAPAPFETSARTLVRKMLREQPHARAAFEVDEEVSKSKSKDVVAEPPNARTADTVPVSTLEAEPPAVSDAPATPKTTSDAKVPSEVRAASEAQAQSDTKKTSDVELSPDVTPASGGKAKSGGKTTARAPRRTKRTAKDGVRTNASAKPAPAAKPKATKRRKSSDKAKTKSATAKKSGSTTSRRRKKPRR